MKMFLGIDIELTGPICQCKQQKLLWTPIMAIDGVSLKISCAICKVELWVPHKEFKARFSFRDECYPGLEEKVEKKDATVLKLVLDDDDQKN